MKVMLGDGAAHEVERGQKWERMEPVPFGIKMATSTLVVLDAHDDFFVYVSGDPPEQSAMTRESLQSLLEEGAIRLAEEEVDISWPR